MGKKKKNIFQNMGRLLTETVHNIGEGLTNVANSVRDGVNNTVQKVGGKIKETRISFNPISLNPITFTNEGGSIKRKLRLKVGYKNLLIKEPRKWRSLLVTSLFPNSNVDIIKNIYYINGILTNPAKAVNNLSRVQAFFSNPIHIVKLIYNPTNGIHHDTIETKKDYDWFLSTIEGKQPEDFDHNWFFSHNIVSLFRKPIENPVTLAIISLLYVGMEKKSPIGLIASSQGTLISFNAIVAFAKLGGSNEVYLKTKVKVCHIGSVVPIKRLDLLQDLLLKYEAHSNSKDIIANTVGLTSILEGGIKKHDIEYYLPGLETANSEYGGNLEPFVKKEFFLT